MKIHVRMFGHFIERFGFGTKAMIVKSPCTAQDLMARLKMKKVPHIVTRNGVSIRAGEKLKDGDHVMIAPVFSGG